MITISTIHGLVDDHVAIPLPCSPAQQILYYQLRFVGVGAVAAARCCREVDLAPGPRWQLAALEAAGVDSLDAEDLLHDCLSRCAQCGCKLASRHTCAIDPTRHRAYCRSCGYRRTESP